MSATKNTELKVGHKKCKQNKMEGNSDDDLNFERFSREFSHP